MKFQVDSRKITDGQIFVAIKGHTVDGHDYIDDAIKNGASKIIAEHEVKCSVPVEVVPSTLEYLKVELKKEYADKINQLKIIGLTGTNGKTTTAYLTYQLLNSFNEKAAYLGTIGFKAPNDEIETENTTPDILTIYSLLLHAIEIGCKTVVMEVSSHALSYERIYGLHIDIAAFTNLTEDHLDYHKTMENYLNAKLKIFDYMNSNGKLIVNHDDKASEAFVNKFGKGITLGYNNENNDYNIINADINPAETKITFTYDNKKYEVVTNLTSKFNVYNYMTSLAILHECGYEIDNIIEKTKYIKAPKGRCETHKVNGGYAVIDYAHTPDAMIKVFEVAHEVTKGNVYVVFGCTGDRDKDKRIKMSRIACENAKYVIMTHDDPHFENQEEIYLDMTKGLKYDNYEIVRDRKDAITKGIDMLKENDTLLILGKGHEEFISIKGDKIPFNDTKIANEYINEIKESVN